MNLKDFCNGKYGIELYNILKKYSNLNCEYYDNIKYDDSFWAFGSDNFVYIKCDKGHIYENSIKNLINGCLCRVCSKENQFHYKLKFLDNIYPNIHEFLSPYNDNIIPSFIKYLTTGDKKRVNFICNNGHFFNMRIIDFVKIYNKSLEKDISLCNLTCCNNKVSLKDVSNISNFHFFDLDISSVNLTDNNYNLKFQCINGHLISEKLSFVYNLSRNILICPCCDKPKKFYEDIYLEYSYDNFLNVIDLYKLKEYYTIPLNWVCKNNHNYIMDFEDKLKILKTSNGSCKECNQLFLKKLNLI